jgi:hypothetical protein
MGEESLQDLNRTKDLYSVKKVIVFPSPAGMLLTKLPLAENY